jgi:hypothetical protein
VEPLLVEPGRELPVAVEAQPEPGVAQDVVDGAEAVVGAAHRAVHEGVAPVRVDGDGGHLEQPVVDDRGDQLPVVAIGVATAREPDADGVGLSPGCDAPEQAVRLDDEVGVGRTGERVPPGAGAEVGGGDRAGGPRVDAPVDEAGQAARSGRRVHRTVTAWRGRRGSSQ